MNGIGWREAVGHAVSGLPISLIHIEPVVAAVVVDDVQDDVHAPLVGGIHQVSQLLARAEAGVDVQEVLDTVAVIRFQIDALFPGGIDPQCGDAQILQIVQLALYAPQRAAGEPRAGLHPGRLISGFEPGRVLGVKELALLLVTVAKPVG